jgi:hypothetical protein
MMSYIYLSRRCILPVLKDMLESRFRQQWIVLEIMRKTYMTKVSKELVKKDTLVDASEVLCWDEDSQTEIFTTFGTYYIINAMNQYHFYKTKSRAEAREFFNYIYGAGKYSVRVTKDQKGSGNYTCTGVGTR